MIPMGTAAFFIWFTVAIKTVSMFDCQMVKFVVQHSSTTQRFKNYSSTETRLKLRLCEEALAVSGGLGLSVQQPDL